MAEDQAAQLKRQQENERAIADAQALLDKRNQAEQRTKRKNRQYSLLTSISAAANRGNSNSDSSAETMGSRSLLGGY